MDKIHTVIVFILSIPLMIYSYLIHLYECVIKMNGKFKDKLFMRRFRLIDSKHVDDFLKWNSKYIEDREKIK